MIIFLHGFLGTPQDFHPVLKNIHIPYQALTLPGHCNKPLDLEKFEEEIPFKSTLVGYSLGGRIAMHLAKKYPEKIKKLIIVSAAPGLYEPRDARKKKEEKWIEVLNVHGIDHFLSSWYQQEIFKSFKPGQNILELRKKHNINDLIDVMTYFSPTRFGCKLTDLKKLPKSTIFLFGENDKKYIGIGNQIKKHAKVLTIKNCSHAIHLEAPDELARIINMRLYGNDT
mgnify:CR=1 FL=1